MAVYVGANELSKIYVGNSNGNSIYLGDKKVWPVYPDLTPVIEEIKQYSGFKPIHYCQFNGSMNQTILTNPNGTTYTPYSFAATPFATYVKGVGGRKALQMYTSDISLATQAKGDRSVFISMLIKQTTSNNSYSGILGGTIFGLNTQGFGYALGWAPSIQSNKICAESYAGGAAAAAYSSTAMTTNKWYHIMIEFRAPITAVGYGTPTSWISVNGSTFVQANGTGSIGSPLDYSDLTDSYIHLGCTWQSRKNYFKGLIQDFVLWTDHIDDYGANLLINYYKKLEIY